MPSPIPYIIGVADKEQAELLGCKEGDEYAVFKGDKEARAFVCDLHMGKAIGVNADLLSAAKSMMGSLRDMRDKAPVAYDAAISPDFLTSWDMLKKALASATQS
jgi:hypothetical protein